MSAWCPNLIKRVEQVEGINFFHLGRDFYLFYLLDRKLFHPSRNIYLLPFQPTRQKVLPSILILWCLCNSFLLVHTLDEDTWLEKVGKERERFVKFLLRTHVFLNRCRNLWNPWLSPFLWILKRTSKMHRKIINF